MEAEAPFRAERRFWQRPSEWVDALVCTAATILAAYAVTALDPASVARLLLVVPFLALVPGYLALQSFVVERRRRMRWLHPLYALGLSPAVIGLAALATQGMGGGFREGNIVLLLTWICLALAMATILRRLIDDHLRRRRERRPEVAPPVEAPPVDAVQT